MFPPTHWSLLAAASLGEGLEGAAALTELIRLYKKPVRQFIVVRCPEGELEDVTQAFFLHFLRCRIWEKACPEKGKFRSYLCRTLINFLNKTKSRDALLSLDDPDIGVELLSHTPHPGREFDYRWALDLMERACTRVEADLPPERRTVLKGFLFGGRRDSDYPTAAAALKVTEANLRQLLHRLQLKTGQELRRLVADTVDPHQVDEEMSYIFDLLMNPPPQEFG